MLLLLLVMLLLFENKPPVAGDVVEGAAEASMDMLLLLLLEVLASVLLLSPFPALSLLPSIELPAAGCVAGSFGTTSQPKQASRSCPSGFLPGRTVLASLCEALCVLLPAATLLS